MNKKQITCIIVLVFIFISLLIGVIIIKNLGLKQNPKTDDNNISSSTKDYFKKTTVRTTINDAGEVVTLPPESSEVPTESTTQNGETTTTEGQTSGNTTTSKKSTTTTKKTTTTQAIPSKISCSNRETISVTSDELFSKIGHPYNSNTCIKWNGFIKGSKDSYDGSVPTEWLGDPVYTSMIVPSESMSNFMISAWRYNAHFMDCKESDMHSMMLPIGAVYMTKDANLPENFTLNFGKIILFGYSKIKKKWVVISSVSKINSLTQYSLPWESSKSKSFKDRTIDNGTYTSLTLNKSELNDGYVLHYWGKLVNFDKTEYSYYASAYEVWTSTPSAVGGLTATSGIDTKDNAQSGGVQLYSSYGMKVTTSKRVLWGHTIPMNEYDYYRDSVQLQNLFNSN